jgi:hyperosmotically inducible protein
MMRLLPAILLLAITTACRTNESPEQQVKDSAIAIDVKAKLAQELGATSLTNISVNVTDGVVTLSGTVHDSAEKSKAVALARAVPSVASVNDNLQIPGSPRGRLLPKLLAPLRLDPLTA